MFFSRKNKIKKEFEKIYDSNIEHIFRFAYLKVSSKDDAEDITSRAFVKLWEALNSENKNNIKNSRAFLYKITRNLVIDYYRTNRYQENTTKNQKKQVSFEKVVVVDKEMRADEKAILDSELEEVKTALSKINEDYQTIIILYYLNELTAAEIAELLGKPESSIRVLIHRAMAALRKELKIKKKKS